MRRKPGTTKSTADRVVKDIRRKTRKRHSAEEKIRIVLEGQHSRPFAHAVAQNRPTDPRVFASVRQR